MLPLQSYPINTLSSSTISSSPSSSPLSFIGVSDLASVLIQCFGLILVGYISGKLRLISERESKGISTFVGYFSLPALIFQSLATSDLSTINWGFVAGIFVSKVFLFILVSLITLIITKPSNIGLAGLYGIFCTQSNDFALGYPLLASLYHTKHPEFAGYLYVLAPIQLAIINPIGLILMEIQKQIENNKTGQRNGSRIFFSVVKQIFKNPILIMTIAGIVWNLTCGPSLPVLILPFFKVLSGAFSATALFLLGLNMVGRFSMFSKSNSSAILLPITLVMTKIILLPLIIKFVIQYLILDSFSKEAVELNNFGFLYGTFPAAPTVFIFALQYDLTTAVVTTGMVLSTIFSAPLMFISANMIRQLDETSEDSYQKDLANTMCYSGLLSTICIYWVLIVLIFGRKWKSLTHRCTLALAVSQWFVGIGGFLWNYIESDKGSMNVNFISHLQYIFTLSGTLSSHIWTCVLAITMALIHWKSLCYVIRVHNILLLIATFSTFFLVSFIIFDPNYQRTNIDIDGQLGIFQYASVIILGLSIIITIFAILTQQYLKNKSIYYQCLNTNNSIEVNLNESENQGLCTDENRPRISRRRTISNQTLHSENVIEVEDIVLSHDTCPMSGNCSTEQRKRCNQNIKKYYEEIQESVEPSSMMNVTNASQANECHELVHHFLLLLALLLSMIIGLTVTVGKIILEKPSGIFIELEFLDILLNYGQGVVTFLIFGFDANFVFSKITKLLRNSEENYSYQFKLEQNEDIQATTKQICDQFICFHRDVCSNEILFKHKVNGETLNVFLGKDLVNWVLSSGLASSRKNSEIYCRHLLLGHVIEHLTACQHFHDGPFIYKFCDLENDN